MDKDSHLIFEDYVKALDEKSNMLVPRNRGIAKNQNIKQKSEDAGYTRTISLPGDREPRQLPQDPNVSYAYSDTEPDDDVIDVTGEELPQRQLSQPKYRGVTPPSDEPVEPRYRGVTPSSGEPIDEPVDEPIDEPVDEPDNNDTPGPIISGPASTNKFNDYYKSLKKPRSITPLVKGVGKLANLANPFSKTGALGYINQGLDKVNRYVKSGEPLLPPRLSKNLGNTIAGAKSTVERDNAISQFRQTNIYGPNKDNDVNLNNAAARAFNSQFPITPKQQKKLGMGSEILKRDKEIKTAAHLANIVLDILVSKIKKSVPYNRALQQAKAEVNNPKVVAELERSGVLPVK